MAHGIRRRARVRRLSWALLVLALTGATAILLRRTFYYGNDDLLEFGAARQKGLSWSYLSLNVWEHFAPYNRLLHFVVVQFSDLSPALGLWLVLVNVAALLAACLWLMTELRLSAPRRVVALILIALSVPTTESAIWFDAGNHILAAIAVTLAVCAAHVRGVRTGVRHWHTLAAVLFVLGQLTQERPLFALPLLVLIDVLLVWRTLPWAERVRNLWALRGPLAVLTVAALAIAAALRAFVLIDHLDTPSWSLTGRTMLSALTNYTVPSLLNLPRQHPADLTVQLLVLVILALSAVVVALVRRGNAGPVVFAAAVFLLYYGFLKLSPLLSEPTLDYNAQRLNYAVYVTIPTVIALAHLRGPGWGPIRPPALRPARPGLGRALRLAGSLSLAGYLLVTNTSYLDRQWADTAAARAYLDAVRAGAPQWSDGGVTLLPLRGPVAMATAWSEPLARHEKLLPLIDKGYAPHDAGTRFALIDSHGDTRRVVLDTLRPTVQIDDGECQSSGRGLVDDADVSFRPVHAGPLFLMLRYRATEDLDLVVNAGFRTRWTLGRGATTLSRGEHTRMVPIDGDRTQTLDLDVRTTGATMCVEKAAVVRPLLPTGDDGICQAVDSFGRPTVRLSCPDSQVARSGAG